VDDSLHVEADEMLLTSAVSNLLHNAIECSQSGARVRLCCRAEPEGVVIEVEDECGGSPSASTRLLQGNVILGAGMTHAGSALSISQRATEAMGGTISVENRPGDGCSFRLTFPLARPNRSSSPPPSDWDASSR
jgi:signal transduction histidine kinase